MEGERGRENGGREGNGNSAVIQWCCVSCRCVFVEADTRCEVCETRLLTQGFYMFPCHHAFHRDCLLTEVTMVTTAAVMLRKRERGGVGPSSCKPCLVCHSSCHCNHFYNTSSLVQVHVHTHVHNQTHSVNSSPHWRNSWPLENPSSCTGLPTDLCCHNCGSSNQLIL